SDQIYVEKIDKNPEGSIQQVKLYIHLKQGDNKDFYLMDLNHLLIENKFAVWSNRNKPIEQTSMDLSIQKDLKFHYKNSSKKINIDPSVYRKNFDNLGSIKLALSEYSLKKVSLKAIKEQDHSEDEDKMNSTIKSVASTVFDQDKLDTEFSNLLDLEKYIKNPTGSKTIGTKSWRTMDPYIFTHNTSVISIQSTKDQRIHPSVRDFLSLHGILTVSDLNAYLWPCILHGLHTFFMPDEHDQGKNSPVAFITPLMSLLLEKSSQEMKKKFETGFVKRSIAQSQCQNGPILLVVCASSENAQKIYEIINQIIQIDSRLNGRDKLKALMIQGGGHENQYDVPLTNGIDILIAATPFCLLRAIGEAKTNLERIRYIIFDQANLLLEKFPLQIKTLMEVYTNFIEINECPYRAQFVLISHFWSSMLKKFIDKFLIKPAFIIGNKLEASFYGQTHHVLKDMEADQTVNKGSMIRKLIEKNRHHNVLICANTFERTIKLYDYLLKKCQIEVDCVTHESRSPKIHTLEEKWSQKQSQGMVMVIQQQMLEHLNIDSVKCVINYDFPLTKTAYAMRLWTMRSYFVQKRDLTEAKNDGPKSNESFRVEANSNGQWENMESDCLCSYLLLNKSSSGFAYSLFNFLSRIGYQKSCFPHGFLKMVEECRLKKEESKLEYPLCPYVKSFGSCMNANPNSCKYRHRPNRKVDQVGLLDKDLTVPAQGYVRFKISFIKDTNHFFGNIISHQDFNEENNVCYDQFKELDLTIQLYFSDTNNIKYLSKFKEDELYAFKDTSTSVFKRIKIEEVIRKDGQIAFELVVKCIDYGSKLQISAQDLIKLPDQFKILPPQSKKKLGLYSWKISHIQGIL
ncbi:ATP-dependent RNA helicase TDRD12 isoform X1, partial [Brachionus plicatilis]